MASGRLRDEGVGWGGVDRRTRSWGWQGKGIRALCPGLASGGVWDDGVGWGGFDRRTMRLGSQGKGIYKGLVSRVGQWLLAG